MSFHPGTGLVYIPAIDLPSTYQAHEYGGSIGGVTSDLAPIAPGDHDKLKGTGFLTAWDPITQSSRWRVELDRPFNGGVLSTAGKLVFQGDAAGQFKAYHAESGQQLWSAFAGTAVQAAPISYALNGEQTVLLPAGAGGFARTFNSAYLENPHGQSRLLAFRLGGKTTLPPPAAPPLVPAPPKQTASTDVIERGRSLYSNIGCNACHGNHVVSGGSSVKDLRYLTAQTHAEWNAIVLGGSRKVKGMVAFGEVLSVQDSDAIHAYVIDLAGRTYARQQAQNTDETM